MPIAFFRIIAALTAFIPLLVMPVFDSAYIFPQTMAFRVISTLLLAGCLLYGVIVFKRSLLLPLVSLGAFLTALKMSAVFGLDVYVSIYGTADRFGSVMDWFFVVAFIICCMFLYADKSSWKWVIRSNALTGLIIGLLALAQYFSLPIIFVSGQRAFSTLGNPAFLASYAVLIIGMLLHGRQSDRSLKHAYTAIAFLLSVVILLTESRAALMALGVGLILYGFIIVRSKLKTPSTRFVVLSALAIIASLLIAAIAVNMFSQSFRILTLDSGTLTPRLAAWMASLYGFIERPILGFGEGLFSTVWFRYYDPAVYDGAFSSFQFDRAHNEFLDRFVLGGFIGGAAYLALWYFILFRLLKKKAYALASFGLGYAVYLFFFFHSIADTILWSWYVAYAFTAADVVPRRSRLPLALGVASLVLMFGVSFVIALRPTASQYLIQQAEAIPDNQAVSYYASAWSLSRASRNSVVDSVFERFSDSVYPDVSETRTFDAYARVLLAEQISSHPSDVRWWLLRAESERRGSADADSLARAESAIRAASALAPRYPWVYVLGGFVETDLMSLGDPEGLHRIRAIESFRHAYALAPHKAETAIVNVFADALHENSGRALVEFAQSFKAPDVRYWQLLVDCTAYVGDVKALQDVQDALRSVPGYAEALGLILLNESIQGSIDERVAF